MDKESLRRAVQFGVANGKRNMVVDLEAIAALFLDLDTMQLQLRQLASEVSKADDAAYRMGYSDALTNYAVWNDGGQYVGVGKRPLNEVLAEVKQAQIPIRYF